MALNTTDAVSEIYHQAGIFLFLQTIPVQLDTLAVRQQC